MRDANVRRFIAISAAPVGDAGGFLERAIVFPLLYRFFGNAYEDMKRMETTVRQSDRAWTIFRPPQLVNRPATGKYRTSIDEPLPRPRQIGRADLASAMLEAVDDPALVRRIVTISY